MPDERAAAHAQRREDVARAGGIDAPLDGRPHPAQRLGHAPHRPPRQRRVAEQLGLERAAREQAHEQPDRRARVAAVERARPPPCRPAKPTPWTRASSPASVISTPSARSAAAVDRLSPPRPSPRASTAPSASAPNSSARCEIDLSPGTRQCPRSGPERRTLSVRRLGASSLLHYHIASRDRRPHFRFFASACNTASSFSARPSRRSAPMCRRTWTREPSARHRQPFEHRREPEQHHHLLPRVEPRGVVPHRRRRGGVSGAVEQRQPVQIEVVAEVQPRADPPQPVRETRQHPGGARAHAVGDRDRRW